MHKPIDRAINELLSLTIKTTLEDLVKETAEKHDVDYNKLFKGFNSHLEAYGDIGN